MVVAVLLSTINAFAQIKNAKTETVKIYGNCDMCKTVIEKAGNLQKVASVDWNKDTNGGCCADERKYYCGCN